MFFNLKLNTGEINTCMLLQNETKLLFHKAHNFSQYLIVFISCNISFTNSFTTVFFCLSHFSTYNVLSTSVVLSLFTRCKARQYDEEVVYGLVKQINFFLVILKYLIALFLFYVYLYASFLFNAAFNHSQTFKFKGLSQI